MLSDPQSVTYNGTATSLVGLGGSKGANTYASTDGSLVLDIKHQTGARSKTYIGLSRGTLVPNPYNPTTNRRVSNRAYLVIDGDPTTAIGELQLLTKALLAAMSASTYANLDRIIAGES